MIPPLTRLEAPGGSHLTAPRPISIEQLLHWTFATQRAELDPPRERGREEHHARPGVGSEWVIWQRFLLGATVDVSRRCVPDRTHEDAESVAAVVQGLFPFPVAREIAGLAQAGRRPDVLFPVQLPNGQWIETDIPRAIPKRMIHNRHGAQAERTKIGEVEVAEERWGGRRTVRKPVEVCWFDWRPDPAQVAGARRRYCEWWAALHEIRERLIAASVLRDHALTGEMPPAQPWAVGA